VNRYHVNAFDFFNDGTYHWLRIDVTIETREKYGFYKSFYSMLKCE